MAACPNVFAVNSTHDGDGGAVMMLACRFVHDGELELHGLRQALVFLVVPFVLPLPAIMKPKVNGGNVIQDRLGASRIFTVAEKAHTFLGADRQDCGGFVVQIRDPGQPAWCVGSCCRSTGCDERQNLAPSAAGISREPGGGSSNAGFGGAAPSIRSGRRNLGRFAR